jgi:uncharacterized membrane protein YebE (DUF533 family)
LTKGSSGDLLGTILSGALGGAQSRQTHGGGGLGDLLGSVLGGASQGQSSGGLGDLLGSVLGGSAQGGGGLGDLLGSVLGGGAQGGSRGHSDGLGDLLGGDLGSLIGGALAKHVQTVDPDAPTPMPDDYSMLPDDLEPQHANKQAVLLIRTMINAAKADGQIDQAEQQAILEKLGQVTQEEIEFIRNEFAKPLDLESFVNEVPRGMEHQVYLLSLATIDLDKQSEANYLGALAQALRITPDEANAIHEQLGAPKIFA